MKRFDRRAPFIGIVVLLLLAMMGIACDAPPDGLDAPHERTATASTALTSTFPVTFDSTAVSATLFNLYPATTGGFLPNVVTTMQLEASAYQLCIPAGGNCFDFTVSTDGSLAYAPELDTFVSGRGTSTLQVHGFPVTIDATAIHVNRINIAHGEVADGPNAVATYSLVPGAYDLCVPAENNCFVFTVSATGQIDYEPSRDTYLAGRGSSTLTVGGFAITVDASTVSADGFNIDFGGVGSFPNAPVTVTLVPGSYNVCVPSSNDCFDFSVALDGALDFAHTLDSYVSGRGLRRLTIVGFPITIDATAVTADRFNVDFGSVGTAAVSAPTTYSLVPGIYSMCVPASNNCFTFSVSLSGLLDFSASLDGFVSGRSTRRLTVRGFPINIDATGESATTFNVDFGSVGSGPNQPTARPRCSSADDRWPRRPPSLASGDPARP